MNDLEPILREALEETIFEVNLRLMEDFISGDFIEPVMYIEAYQELKIEIPKKKFSLRNLIKKNIKKIERRNLYGNCRTICRIKNG